MSSLRPEFRQKLSAALLSAFPDRRSLEEMVYFHLNENLNRIASEGNLQSTVVELMQWAEAHGRVESLLKAARTANPDNRLLKSLGMVVPIATPVAAPAAIVAAGPAIDHVYDVLFFAGDRPFIDREELRNHLRTLATGGAEILVVSGPPGSGRSYSWEFIYHVSAALGIAASYVPVQEEAVAGLLTPEHLAERLAIEAGLGPALPSDSSLQPANALARWLVAAFVNIRERWWIVLDGLEHPDVPLATHEFLGRMMLAASEPTTRGRLGFILLAHDAGRIPERLRPHVMHEHLSPLTRSDVFRFLEQYVSELRIPVTSEMLAEISDQVLEETEKKGQAGLNAAMVKMVRAFRDRPPYPV